MKFTIVIPVYKTEHLLARCLDSFAAQTDGDFEVIVVDDGSPGDAGRSGIAPYQAEGHSGIAPYQAEGRSGIAPYQAEGHSGIAPCQAEGRSGSAPYQAEEIVKRYDARFKYVRHERNLSLFQARQTGLGLAQGEYVVPFDSDDYALPGLLERLDRVIGEDRRQETGDAGGSHDLQPPTSDLQPPASPDVIVYQMMYDRSGKLVKPSVRYRDERLTGEEALDRFFASRIQCGICGKAIRREIYRSAMEQLAAPRDFYLNSSEDLCQTLPVLLNARTVVTVSYPGYRYRLNGDSLTETLADPAKLGTAAENTRRVFDTLADFIRRTQGDRRDEFLSRLERFLRPTLRWYLGCIRRLPEAEWRACVAELDRHFPPDLVAREAMLLVAESNSYRIGRALVRPLKAFRRSVR